jgi:hypothetical protein
MIQLVHDDLLTSREVFMSKAHLYSNVNTNSSSTSRSLGSRELAVAAIQVAVAPVEEELLGAECGLMDRWRDRQDRA